MFSNQIDKAKSPLPSLTIESHSPIIFAKYKKSLRFKNEPKNSWKICKIVWLHPFRQVVVFFRKPGPADAPPLLRNWARNWWVWSRGDKPALAKETAADAANSGLTAEFSLHLAVPQKYGHQKGSAQLGGLGKSAVTFTWRMRFQDFFKWFGSALFISAMYSRPFGRGSHSPILRGRKRSPWLWTT